MINNQKSTSDLEEREKNVGRSSKTRGRTQNLPLDLQNARFLRFGGRKPLDLEDLRLKSMILREIGGG
jgi:hypothetical protein